MILCLNSRPVFKVHFGGRILLFAKPTQNEFSNLYITYPLCPYYGAHTFLRINNRVKLSPLGFPVNFFEIPGVAKTAQAGGAFMSQRGRSRLMHKKTTLIRIIF